MAFQEIVDLDCSVDISLGGTNKKTNKPNPTSIQGYYIGSRQVASKKAKSGFSSLHVFQTPKGNVGVWGKTNLDQKLGTVTPGCLTKVTFTGMVPTNNNPMYKYSVQVDKDNSIEVSPPQDGDTASAGAEAADSGAYDGSDDSADGGAYGESEDDVDQEQPEETPPPRAQRPAQPAQAPGRAQQSKVQALLNSRKTA